MTILNALNELPNARRACRAVEDGQYRKAIQALASGGLALPTVKVVVA